MYHLKILTTFTMKSKLLHVSRLVTYSRNFQSITHRSYSWKRSAEDGHYSAIRNESESNQVNESEVHLLGPKDFRAPLPGNVGVAHSYLNPAVFLNPSKSKKEELPVTKKSDLFESETSHERHRNVLAQYLTDGDEEVSRSNILSNLCDILEITAQDCPQLVKKDISDLFPNRHLLLEDLTVITLSHKTINDMSVWSPETDKEREELTAYFVTAAQEICDIIKVAGYWADFIDPTSGRPHLGPFTNDTLYETDERYRHFGLTIEDLGCCKVISHHIWGTRTFVGCVFTTAPIGSELVRNILDVQMAKNSA